MRRYMDAILVDTSAFVALLSTPDKNHTLANEQYRQLTAARVPFLTTNHVLDETCTWLLYHARNGHRKALEFGELVSGASALVGPIGAHSRRHIASGLSVIYSTPEIENRAWEIFRRYDTAGFSFTDCISFAVMQSLGISRAFAFDTHFDVAGFERL